MVRLGSIYEVLFGDLYEMLLWWWLNEMLHSRIVESELVKTELVMRSG